MRLTPSARLGAGLRPRPAYRTGRARMSYNSIRRALLWEMVTLDYSAKARANGPSGREMLKLRARLGASSGCRVVRYMCRAAAYPTSVWCLSLSTRRRKGELVISLILRPIGHYRSFHAQCVRARTEKKAASSLPISQRSFM